MRRLILAAALLAAIAPAQVQRGAVQRDAHYVPMEVDIQNVAEGWTASLVLNTNGTWTASPRALRRLEASAAVSPFAACAAHVLRQGTPAETWDRVNLTIARRCWALLENAPKTGA